MALERWSGVVEVAEVRSWRAEEVVEVLHLSVLQGQDGRSKEVMEVVHCGQVAAEEASVPQRSWVAGAAGRRKGEAYLVLGVVVELDLDSVVEAGRRVHGCL